jgi:hypothetical protein
VLLPTFTNRGNSIVPVVVVALGLLLYIYFHPGVRTAREDAREDAPDDTSGAGEVVELDARRQAKGGS